jgi:hypothetical protein
LLSISLPPSTEFLEHLCFAKCENLGGVHFEAGSNLHVIESESFKGCDSLKLIRVPESVSGREGLDLSGVSGFELSWY